MIMIGIFSILRLEGVVYGEGGKKIRYLGQKRFWDHLEEHLCIYVHMKDL